ncbi:hypothetical protein DL764_004232 [Monosporascus ibericus]|uniref:Uncharacterized protein n=1 Tax=Monosporascus ibericus TaxID=155417 RepID=A0A4V1XB26_9PEZI|nr:hypothetical protein DL764_004232 [Monosporascus ibericus]
MPSGTAAGDRVPPLKVQKTERSHEENQERAYIAASRRADRSLEARVQSARMASEIHRRRTGRGLKVTEEIVLREEMYEEEEDDLPRQYKYLTAHLQTSSPDMNSRVNAYITTQAAMATMARYNEVNRLFSESFPTTQARQQQLNQSMYMAPFVNTGQFSPPLPDRGTSSPTSPPQVARSQSHRDSIDTRLSIVDSAAPTSKSTASSPPALSPSSSTTPESRNTPYQTPASAFASLQLDQQLAQQTSSSSIFTSELPNEVKQMANIDMSDPMARSFLGYNSSAWSMFTQLPGGMPKQDGKGFERADESYRTPDATEDAPNKTETIVFPSLGASVDYLDSSAGGYSQTGTPGGAGGGDGWESFVDFGSEH